MNAILNRPDPVDISKILTAEIKEKISGPIDRATGLPNAAYTDADWYDEEKTRIFARSWVPAAFCSELPEPGCRLVTEVAGQPILLVRNKEGAIHGFYNVCRHRGTTLCNEKKGKSALITCPYHSWTYDLDGKLKARPHFHGAAQHDIHKPASEEDTISLIPVRIEVFHEFILVNLDGNAPSFKEYLDPVSEFLEGYELSNFVLANTMEYDIKTNWKFVTENYIDALHKPTIHPALEVTAPLSTNEPPIIRDNFIAHIHTVANPADGRGAGLPHIKTSEEKKMWGLGVHIFPSLNVLIWPDQMIVVQLTPKGPARTLEQIRVLFASESMSDKYEEARNKVYEVMHTLNLEDMRPMEGMQQGRACSEYDGGIYCPYWDTPIHHFSQLAMKAMTHSNC